MFSLGEGRKIFSSEGGGEREGMVTRITWSNASGVTNTVTRKYYFVLFCSTAGGLDVAGVV